MRKWKNIETVSLPKYKSYLYDLMERLRIYKGICKNRITFGLRVGEFWLIKTFLEKWGKGGVLTKSNRAFIYHHFVALAERKQSNLTAAEYAVAIKLSNIKKLHLEELFMELSQMREFAEEVGLSKKDIKGMDEDEIIIEVLVALDPDSSYSKRFIEWYEALPMDYFKKAEKKKKTNVDIENSDDKSGKVDYTALRDKIDESSDSLKKLHKICESNEDVFPAKLLKIDDEEKLEKKMITTLDELEEESKKSTDKTQSSKSNNDENSNKEKENKMSKLDAAIVKKIVKKITAAEDIADLKDIVESFEDIFEDITLKKSSDFDEKKAEILAVIGIKGEKEEESNGDIDPKIQKKLAKKIEDAEEISELKEIAEDSDFEKIFEDVSLKKKDDVDEKKEEMLAAIGIKKSGKAEKEETSDKDIDELMGEWEEMGIGTLKKTAKGMGLSITPDTKKKDILKLMKKTYLEGDSKKDEDEDEIELTPSMIKKMVKAKDLEALQAAQKTLKVNTSSIVKRSVTQLGEALIDHLSGSGEPEEKEDKKGKDKSKSIFAMIKDLVEEEMSTKKIITKVTPWFEEHGKDDEDFIESKVKEMVAVIKLEIGDKD